MTFCPFNLLQFSSLNIFRDSYQYSDIIIINSSIGDVIFYYDISKQIVTVSHDRETRVSMNYTDLEQDCYSYYSFPS